MNAELLLAALHHMGKPSTAADIFDAALGLGRAAGWSREQLAVGSVQKAAKLLERMHREDKSVFIHSKMLENGNSRNAWAPNGDFTSGYPVPDPPTHEEDRHPLDGMSRPQQLAVFDASDNMLHEFRRQRRELHAMMERHDDELERLINRAKQSLAALGLIQ